jgi:thioredoxin 1
MKYLNAPIHEIESATELEQILKENENVMVCCGRMGPMCIPVFVSMRQLQDEGSNTKFYAMSFDNPDAGVIRNAPETKGFMGLPFTMYYKNAKVVKATSSIQSKEQIVEVLENQLS